MPNLRSTNCKICQDPNIRLLAELGWNAKMSTPAIAKAMGDQFAPATLMHHLKLHVEGGEHREIRPDDVSALRARVFAIQQLQIDEVERRWERAQRAAEFWNAHAEPDDHRDPSFYFDILDKNLQSAIGSIIKSQGVAEKAKAAEADQKIDMFRLMLGGGDGLAPKQLMGPIVEGEVEDVD